MATKTYPVLDTLIHGTDDGKAVTYAPGTKKASITLEPEEAAPLIALGVLGEAVKADKAEAPKS